MKDNGAAIPAGQSEGALNAPAWTFAGGESAMLGRAPLSHKNRTIGDIIRAHAELRPNAPALVTTQFAPLTYRELQFQIDSARSRLRQAGFADGARIAVALPSGAQAALTMAVLACSAVVIPLDPKLTFTELKRCMNILQPEAVLVLRDVNSPARRLAEHLNLPVIEMDIASAGNLALEFLPPQIGPGCSAGDPEPEAPAFILHTSGTTADPNLVPVSHRNLLAVRERLATWFELRPQDRCLSVGPVYYSHALTTTLLPPLLTGGSVAFPVNASKVDVSEWLCALRPTWYSAGPTLHLSVLDKLKARSDSRSMHALRFISSAGAPLASEIRAELETALGVPILEHYGSSETSQISANRLTPGACKSGTCGRPWPGIVMIADEDGQEVAAGERGEVLITGPTVMSGYLNSPELNRAVFRNGWYRTGDIGSLDADGFLSLHARKKELINRGSEKISPLEIDRALLHHPAVVEAAAYGVPHPRLGEDVAAAVVLHPGARVTSFELREFLTGQLATFKIPRRIDIVDQLPKGITGKVQRNRLSLQSQNDIERQSGADTKWHPDLLELWKRFLKSEDVTIDDDFFAKGDSLLAMDLHVELERRVGQELPESILLEAPTIRELSDRLSIIAGSRRKTTPPAADRLPLALFHYDRIEDRVFLDGLAHALPASHALLPIALRAAHGGRTPQTSAATSALLRLLLEVQPQGPYRLSGFGQGSVAALEAAGLLLKEGHKVELVALIDPPASAARRFGQPPLRRLWSDVRRAWSNPRGKTTTKQSQPAPTLPEPLLVFSSKFDNRAWQRISPDVEVISWPGDRGNAERSSALLAPYLRARLDVIGSPPPARRKAPAAPASAARARSLLDTQVIALSSLPDWRREQQDPYTRHIAPYKGFLSQSLALDKKFIRGEGCCLFDADGTSYIDCIANFGAVPFGHDPQPIWEALEGVRRESHPNLVITSILGPAGELAERLLAAAPPGFEHVVFTNSGAEAVEAAIKLARVRTGRLGILSARDGFHGLTLAGMSASSRQIFQRGFGAPVAGFDYVPFGDIDELQAALASQPEFFAAFIVEIIQGEAGIQVAPPGYLAAALELCRRFGTLLIVDEVQTGLGRTGALFACEAEGITPDILTLAKALGGGLLPIGACLYTRAVYSEQFDLRHGSTFAGNTLACRAALATIEQLTKDDGQLVRHVAAIGRYLLDELQQLKREYPMLVADVRGRGLMLALELNLDHVAKSQTGMLAMMQSHGTLLYMALSYLLNVEHVRIAPSYTHGSVLRIEPPLIADTDICKRLIDSLRRLLDVLERADTGALIAHFVDGTTASMRPRICGPKRDRAALQTITSRATSRGGYKRFAFIVHLLGIADLYRFDPTLDSCSEAQLQRFREQTAPFARPFPMDDLAVESADHRLTEGELIVLPHLPAELLSLGSDAADLVQSAIDLATERGANVIGLGGFSSIVTYGGLALREQPGITITSGNSLTTWAAIRAVEAGCGSRGMSDRTVAIVGATGAIGHALSLLCAERAAELVLVGNPRTADAGLGKLKRLAKDCRRHVASLAAKGTSFPAGTVASAIARHASETGSISDADGAITITTDIDAYLPKAHIVITATKEVTPFITSRHLRSGAVVCDLSRPVNIAPEILEQRPDLRVVSGGLVQAPDTSVLGYLQEGGRQKVVLACAAETIILGLSGYRSSHLCGRLDPGTIAEIGRLAERLGFSVVG